MLTLSKSRYTLGCRCPRLLWLQFRRPEALPEDEDMKNRAEQGRQVGEIARGLNGDYTLIPYSEDKTEMAAETRALLERGEKNIAEASFICEGLFCSVDLLISHGGGSVTVIEVKSAAQPDRERWRQDVSFQSYVLRKLGYHVEKVYLAHVDSSYVRHGDIDLKAFFQLTDMTEETERAEAEVEEMIMRLRAEPETEPAPCLGEACNKCPAFGLCTDGLPRPNVFDLPGVGCNFGKKLAYYGQGLITLEQLDAAEKLGVRQRRMIGGVLRGETYVDARAVRDFTDTLGYPIYFLDFETCQFAVPRYDGSRPWQQIPFQYSLHWIGEEGGELKHTEYLAAAGADPRRELAERLCADIPEDVCVTAYHMDFENARLRELAELFPDLSGHLLNIVKNMRDLETPFAKQYVYLPAMMGSSSIKKVLPAICPDDPALDYHSLEDVHCGTEASAAWIAMACMAPEEEKRLRANLLKYCGLDTLAMVKVWEYLKSI